MLLENDKLFIDEEFDNELLFASDNDEHDENSLYEKHWKIVIADDEEEVHAMTRMVLKKFEFEGKKIELISAYSGKETIRVMRENPDVAILLLDVVMETENSGLEVVKSIREDLANPFVRIILRTGQPGQAPEEEVIRNYDINDYKSKTELTVQKLYTAVIASLRAYRDMKTIERNRIGLEHIINSSRNIFEMQSLKAFTSDVLEQFTNLLVGDGIKESEIVGLAISSENGKNRIVESTLKYKHFVGMLVEDLDDLIIIKNINDALLKNKTLFTNNYYVGYFNSLKQVENLVYIESVRAFSELEVDLIKIFSSNVAVAFDNIYLNNEIVDTQKEIIYTLGEIVETRSKETANHVRRVSEYSYIIAKAVGLKDEEAKMLRLASPMHDIGKIGIPDYILNKPGKLTKDEFEVIKTHTTIGYEVLKQSSRQIMKTAATIALEHHERWDGNGYPNNIRGEEINIYARITSVADVYDALGHKRVYKEAWSENTINEFLIDQKGKMFDPNIIELFFNKIDEIRDIKIRYPDAD
ncbi:MAG: DUF3369 domain-containing protein [Acidaminobacteraceae bacterium]